MTGRISTHKQSNTAQIILIQVYSVFDPQQCNLILGLQHDWECAKEKLAVCSILPNILFLNVLINR